MRPSSCDSCFWIDRQLRRGSGLPEVLPQRSVDMLSGQQTETSCQLRLPRKMLFGLCIQSLPGIPAQCHRPRITHVDWRRSSGELEQSGGEGSNGNSTHTKCVDQEIVLNLVYVPRKRLVLQRKNDVSWNHTRSPPSDQPGRLHGVLSICTEFWKRTQQSGGQRRGGKILPVRRVVVLSFTFPLRVCHEQVINVISPM